MYKFCTISVYLLYVIFNVPGLKLHGRLFFVLSFAFCLFAFFYLFFFWGGGGFKDIKMPVYVETYS